MGCGNPYDYVMIDVAASETLFLCVPCLIKQAVDMVTAFTEPTSPEAQLAGTQMLLDMTNVAPGPSPRPRGRNAPAGQDDPDLFDAYESRITVDDLPPEFR